MIEKAVFITKYTSTDYMTVMRMPYEMIDDLFLGLIDLMKEEARQQEEAIEEAKRKK